MFNLLKKRGFSKGLTLVETLIYTVVVGITGTLLVGILTTSTRVQTQTSTGTEVSTELNFATETIQRLVKESSVIIVNSDGNTDNDTTPLGEPYSYLILRMKDSAGGTTDRDPIVIWKDAETQSIKVRQGKSPNQTTNEITTSKVLADNLAFRKIVGYPGHDTVQIEMTLTYNTQAPGGAVSRTLKAAIGRVSAATFDSVLLPGTTNTYDIGTSGTMWKDAYLQNTYINNKLGIGTTSPSEKLQVAGGNIYQAPTTPTMIGQISLGTAGYNIYVSGRYAYIVNSNVSGTCSGTTLTGCEFRIYDISNPSAPAAIGGVDLGVSGMDIYVSGRYAYVANADASGTCSGTTLTGCEFRIYDISNPSAPAAIGGVDLVTTSVYVHSLYISGRYVYIGTYPVSGTCSGTTLTGCEFRIYDISNPSAPAAVGGVDLGVANYKIYVSGRYAYVVNDTVSGTCSGADLTGCEFRIYDISNPSAPAAIGGVDLGIYGRGIYISGRYAYVVNGNIAGTCSSADLTGCEFRIYDISNPSTPTAIGGVDLGNMSRGIYISGRYAYLTNLSATGTCSGTDLTGCEIRIYDISNPASPTSIGGIETGGIMYGVYVSGRYMYIVKDTSGTIANSFLIYDVLGGEFSSAMIHSLEAGNLQVRNDIIAQGQLQVSGGVNVGSGGIFSAGSLGTPAINVPGNMPSTTIGSVSSVYSNKVYVQGRYAYVTSQTTNSLQIVDVSNVTSPVQTGSVSASYASSVYVQGRYAYVTSNVVGGSFKVFDISNPTAPVQIGTASAGAYSNDVYVQGQYAYVTSQTGNTLQIFDVSNAASPALLSSTSASYASGVYVQGRYAYVTSNVNGGTLKIFDISNPINGPSLTGSVAAGYSTDVYVQGRYAYVTSETGNTLQIFDVSNPASPAAVTGGSISAPYAVGVYVQGKYAFVSSKTTNAFQIFDISIPTAPISVGSVSAAYASSVYVQGRYAYVTSDVVGGTLKIFDLGGGYVQQLEAGGIETGTLSTRNNLQVGNDLDVKGGVNIGANANITGNLAAANLNRLIQVQEQQPSGTAAGTGVASAWTTRVLNTVVTNTIPGASLASNQVTLPAGSYRIDARSPAMCGAVYHRISLYNVTDASYVIYGQNAQSSSNTYFTDCTPDFLTGNFTITSAKTFEIRYYKTGNYSNALGQATSFGVIEIYEDVTIWKTS